eukprot:1196350-Prorocentrum_minimum.AAC.10
MYTDTASEALNPRRDDAGRTGTRGPGGWGERGGVVLHDIPVVQYGPRGRGGACAGATRVHKLPAQVCAVLRCQPHEAEPERRAGWTNQTRGESIYPHGGPIRRGEREYTRRVDQSDEGRGNMRWVRNGGLSPCCVHMSDELVTPGSNAPARRGCCARHTRHTRDGSERRVR